MGRLAEEVGVNSLKFGVTGRDVGECNVSGRGLVFGTLEVEFPFYGIDVRTVCQSVAFKLHRIDILVYKITPWIIRRLVGIR